MERIRVLIADDHPALRGGLRTLLSALGEAEVVGEASTDTEAVTAAEALQPGVVASNIVTKLQVADRAQATVCAREAGMGQQSTKL